MKQMSNIQQRPEQHTNLWIGNDSSLRVADGTGSFGIDYEAPKTNKSGKDYNYG